MLSFPSQNDRKKTPTGRAYVKEQTRVMTNQHIFKSGPICPFKYFRVKLTPESSYLYHLKTNCLSLEQIHLKNCLFSISSSNRCYKAPK